ncbi:MAG: methyltransferase domain-containing protein [Nannocystaceae bacterium]
MNPLGIRYLEVRARPSHFAQGPRRGARLEVELGCAEGDFSFALARREPDWTVVGLDVRTVVVQRNRAKALRESVDNLEFAYVNLSVDLNQVFEPDRVDRFHLLFPDPWLKARHRKRRVISARLCETIASQLCHGGELHVATDVFELALQAMFELEQHSARALGFVNLHGEWSFAREAPVAVQSRREVITRRRGHRVWRLRYLLGSPERPF